MLSNMLNIKNGVVIRRITEAYDGYGATTTLTTLTTLSRANIWAVGSGQYQVSDKITNSSSHVLALKYKAYTFTDADREATYNGNTYEITGHMDNVAERGELLLVGLKWLS
jgi:hypothetical protein